MKKARARLLSEIPPDRILDGGDGSRPTVGDVVFLYQGFTFPNGRSGGSVWCESLDGREKWSADVYDSEIEIIPYDDGMDEESRTEASNSLGDDDSSKSPEESLASFVLLVIGGLPVLAIPLLLLIVDDGASRGPGTNAFAQFLQLGIVAYPLIFLLFCAASIQALRQGDHGLARSRAFYPIGFALFLGALVFLFF